jgi:fructose-bisphosphate aldolase class II
MQAKHLRESELWSRPEVVEQFVRRSGVDLIVPNLGTEHRTASAEPLDYQHGLAREIAARVGPIQALHGTSSLGGRLGTVGADGICKINYYTAMARAATAAVRAVWAEMPAASTLPIGLACGSFLHRTRRAAIAENISSLLGLLERQRQS